MNYIRKYVLLTLFVALSTNFVPDSAALIPKPSKGQEIWQGLTDLRICLLDRGMLNEAVALFKFERSRLPPVERPDAVLELMNYVEEYASLSPERSAWVEVELRIYLAQSLYERREGAQGVAEFQKAGEVLDRWCSLSKNQPKDTLTPFLEMRLLKLRYTDYNDPFLYYKESTELLEILKACCYPTTSVCYGLAIEAASQLDVSGAPGTYRAHFFRLLHELEVMQETIQEDIKGLLFGQSPLFMDASENVTDLRKVLEWLDGFEKQYKTFNLPDGLMFIHTRRQLAYMRLGEHEKQAQEEARIEKLKDMVPTRIGALVGTRKPKHVTSKPLQGDNPQAELSFSLDIEEDNFYMEWVGTAGKYKATELHAMKLVLQWMLADMKNGTVKDHEVRSLFGFRQIDDGQTCMEQLAAQTPETAYRRLYLQSNDSGHLATDPEPWEDKISTLKAWLSKSTQGTNNGRQYLKVVLQVTRKRSVTEYKALPSIRIREIEKCIAMVDNLPPKVREVVNPRISEWHGDIADQCLAFCVESPEFDSDEVGKQLAKSLHVNLQVTLEYQKQGNIVGTAMRQRATAEVCVLRLHWMLRRKGAKVSDPDLVDVRETGLRCLEQADSFFTLRRQESTWSGGVQGLEERERATVAENAWRLPRTAIQLLTAGTPDLDEDDRVEIWKWTQRSKARSLAMTMGVGGIVPAALLQEVNASEKCRPLYEKMISLQRQIRAAELRKRLVLRQELDLHVAEMRKEELLREVCDLKDGRPLTLSDLDRIAAVAKTAVAETSIVLVDWMFLPGVFDDGTLLLVTTKSGSAPTCTTLAATTSQVSDWINLYLDGRYSQHMQRLTTDLGTLVQPLCDVTKRGDVLIFCPTTSLHRIPLHSIEVFEDGIPEPLIYRNPIVYTQSHSVLRMCLWNSQAAKEASSSLNPLLMHGISNTPGNEKYRAGRQSVQDLADVWSITPYINATATKSNFVSLAPASRLAHIHTHIDWNVSDPLSHSISFSNSAPEYIDTKLTAREIFDLSVPKGTHITLVACSGGLARVTPADEVLGLVPALLHAGTSSTISTLWKIEDEYGAKFTKEFYRTLREEGARLDRGGGFVDLARVFQKAVMKRGDEEERDGLLHWTAFVLHGFWQFWVPGGSIG